MSVRRMGRGHFSLLVAVTVVGCLTFLIGSWNVGSGIDGIQSEKTKKVAPTGLTPAPTSAIRTPVNSETKSTKSPVKIFQISKDNRSKEYVEKVIRALGYYIPDDTDAPRFVTDDDIKATLGFLDEDIKSKRNSSDSATYWNATFQKQLMIVTTWRSGSTLMGEILANHPTVFYHYEPLKFVGRHRFRGGRQGQLAVQLLRGLLSCNYSYGDYINKVKRDTEDMIGRNLQVWPACLKSPNRNTCREPAFLRPACKRFPLVTVKTVRLQLNLTRTLLQEFPNLKIVYLIRDPRAIMNSRYDLMDWCGLQPDCIDPARLCDDISSDLTTFKQLFHLYPDRLTLVQYETLASKPMETFENIFKFSGLSVLPSIRQAIQQHTSSHREGARSTFHKSVDRIYQWKSKLNHSQIHHIQTVCSSVMERLGYPRF